MKGFPYGGPFFVPEMCRRKVEILLKNDVRF